MCCACCCAAHRVIMCSSKTRQLQEASQRCRAHIAGTPPTRCRSLARLGAVSSSQTSTTLPPLTWHCASHVPFGLCGREQP